RTGTTVPAHHPVRLPRWSEPYHRRGGGASMAGSGHEGMERTPVAEKIFATLRTNRGDIVLELFANHAPKAGDNFVGLAEGTKEWTDPKTGQPSTARFYDGLGFHRVIEGFMLQGGCPLGTGRGGPGYEFGDEFHP